MTTISALTKTVLDALAAVDADLEKLDDLQAEIETAQAELNAAKAALADIEERRATVAKQHEQEAAAHQREMAAMEKATRKAGHELKAWQDRLGAAVEEAQTREAENNSLLVLHDNILASLASLKQRFVQ
jgi:predicted  nucleic acid-binding Zn-ribbon protein